MAQPRYRYRRSFFSGYFSNGVKWLLISNTAVFLLWYVGGRAVQSHLLTLFALTPELTVRNFMVWQLVDVPVPAWRNLAPDLQYADAVDVRIAAGGDWGTRRFLKYYFICGIGAGLFDLTLNILFGHWNNTTIGASGAIYGLLLAFGVCYPEQTVLMSFLFPIKAKYMVMIYAGVELLMSTGVNSGVSNIAHLGGMVVGFVYLKSRLPRLRIKLPDWRGAYRQWKLQRAKKKFQVYMKKHDRGPWVN